MGLQLRRRSSISAYAIGILVSMAAFVSQPLYGLIASQIANAAPSPLGAPQLVSPANNAVVNGATLTNQWQPVTGATRYIYESYNNEAATSVRYTASYTTTSKVATNVADGTVFWWRVKAVNAVGAESDWSLLWKVTIDNTAPSVPTGGLPNGTSLMTNDFYFNWNASTDANAVTYLFQSSLNPAVDANGVLTTGVWKSGTLPTPQIHSTGAPNGTWYWQVRAVDAAGNMSVWSQLWQMSIVPDTKGPVVHITAPTASNVRGTATVSGTVSDDHPDHYYLVVMDSTGKVVAGPGTVYQANVSDWQWDTTKLKDGVYTIDLEAKDKLGNKDANSTEKKNITVDNTAPTVVMSADHPTVGATFSLAATATDVSGVASCEYQIFDSSNTVALPTGGGKTAFACDGSTNSVDVSSLTGGDYTVKVWSTDTLGNTSAQNAAQQSFTVDHTAPVVTMKVTSSTTPMASTAVALAGTVDNTNLQSLKLYIDGTETADLTGNVDSKGNWAYTLSGGVAQGSHTLSVVATDVYGNASTVASSPQSSVIIMASAYVPPAGSGNVTPLSFQNLSDTLPQLVTPTRVVAVVPAAPTTTPSNQNDQAVLGAKTSKDDSGANVAATPSVVAPSETGWKLLGIAWYWWLLAFMVGVGTIWTMSTVKHRRQTA
jgi:hypothetical protein